MSKYGVACPKCGSRISSVIDSRASPNGRIRRRRICSSCGERVTTHEVVVVRGEGPLKAIIDQAAKTAAELNTLTAMLKDL
jgi:transcriptional regulator NrdR family protein